MESDCIDLKWVETAVWTTHKKFTGTWVHEWNTNVPTPAHLFKAGTQDWGKHREMRHIGNYGLLHLLREVFCKCPCHETAPVMSNLHFENIRFNHLSYLKVTHATKSETLRCLRIASGVSMRYWISTTTDNLEIKKFSSSQVKQPPTLNDCIELKIT